MLQRERSVWQISGRFKPMKFMKRHPKTQSDTLNCYRCAVRNMSTEWLKTT